MASASPFDVYAHPSHDRTVPPSVFSARVPELASKSYPFPASAPDSSAALRRGGAPAFQDQADAGYTVVTPRSSDDTASYSSRDKPGGGGLVRSILRSVGLYTSSAPPPSNRRIGVYSAQEAAAVIAADSRRGGAAGLSRPAASRRPVARCNAMSCVVAAVLITAALLSTSVFMRRRDALGGARDALFPVGAGVAAPPALLADGTALPDDSSGESASLVASLSSSLDGAAQGKSAAMQSTAAVPEATLRFLSSIGGQQPPAASGPLTARGEGGLGPGALAGDPPSSGSDGSSSRATAAAAPVLPREQMSDAAEGSANSGDVTAILPVHRSGGAASTPAAGQIQLSEEVAGAPEVDSAAAGVASGGGEEGGDVEQLRQEEERQQQPPAEGEGVWNAAAAAAEAAAAFPALAAFAGPGASPETTTLPAFHAPLPSNWALRPGASPPVYAAAGAAEGYCILPSSSIAASLAIVTADAPKAAAVRRAFIDSWAAYKTHAWGKDTLKPVSGGADDDFLGMGITITDSLSTLAVMELWVSGGRG
jgi:hypothetical protein